MDTPTRMSRSQTITGETPVLLKKALESFNRLETVYGNVVIEGAGGAAEVNLYDRDIANVQWHWRSACR